MAEGAIGKVKEMLVSSLKEEANLLKDVDKEVKKIVSQLEDIQSFLKEADKKAEAEGDNIRNGVKDWVQDLREVAFEIEDVVTEYIYHKAEQPPNIGFEECLRDIGSFLSFWWSRLKRRHNMAWNIRDFQERLVTINERGKNNGFINSVQEGQTSTTPQNVTSYDPRKASRYLQENQLVGIESLRDKLVDLLSNESKSQRIVVPVVGMGGLGKTTLAQQVYNHVQGKFQCHAWVQVPGEYKIEEILRTLIKELFQSTQMPDPHNIDTMDEQKLTDELRKFLNEKKYIVIFDDVWKEEFWGDLEHVVIDNNLGGRVMITTRKKQVAEFCRSFATVHIHEMERLPKEKAWELFCKRTFRSEGGCPKELENIARKIAESCECLPLAIVVVAGLLSRKELTMNELRKLQASLSLELGKTSISKILSDSYDELPYHLKPCLLYFGMFPRRRSVRNGRLIRQWIAEGFVKAEEGKSLEEVSQEYMNELINRSLVEASSLDVTGKARSCHVHDLIHGIILKKTKEVSFCQVLPRSSDQSKPRGITRRLSIMINCLDNDLKDEIFFHVHSVVFREDVEPVFAKKFKFLKVLDFEDASGLDHLPEDIGNLFDLRYLSVRGTKVKLLPRSVEKLKNLETLDLRSSFVCELPANMIKSLSKLRNIYAFNMEYYNETKVSLFDRVGIKVMCEIGLLNALQKLLYIELDCSIGVDDPFKELSNLTQLKTLGVLRVRSEDWRSLCASVEKMELLESLLVGSTSEDEVVDLEGMKSPPQFLRNINSIGRLKKLPEWFTQLQHTLVKLRLNYSRLEDDPLEVLQNMHNLLHLEIRNEAYVGEQLCFKEGMFAKLKKLYLKDLTRLHSVIIEETALPMLEELVIGPSPQISNMPTGLQHLKMLKKLLFHLMPREFIMDQDFHTVSCVPQVRITFWDKEGEIVWMTLQDLPKFRQDLMRENEDLQERASTSRSTTDEELREKEGATTSGTTAAGEDHE